MISDLLMPEIDGIELIRVLGCDVPRCRWSSGVRTKGKLRAAFEIAKAHGIRVLGPIYKPITSAKLRELLGAHMAGGV